MNTRRLCDLNVGQKAKVFTVGHVGDLNHRLFDIGLIEGTTVECVGKSPSGDPAAFLIKGAVIALRNKDSKNILMKM